MGVNCYSHEKNSGGWGGNKGGIKITRKHRMKAIKGKEGRGEGRKN
jgi:hypothetical protein